jgi:hypothetical protein
MATYTLQGPSVFITSSSVANPSTITAPKHGFSTGNSVTISGHAGSTPSINGTHAITKTGENTFTIPVNVTVGGTGGEAISARSPKIESLEATWAVNQADVLRCKFISHDRHYIPTKYSETYLYEDATPIFGGNVTRVMIKGFGGDGLGGVECTVEAASFKAKSKNRFVTLSVAAGATLEDVLDAIVAGSFLPSGITLNGGQATGPTLSVAIEWAERPLASCLDELSELTTWPWDILPDKTLLMFEPGVTAAPYDVLSANGVALGDIEVERAANGGPNQIIVKAGTDILVDKTFTLTGDGVTDTFYLQYPVAGPYPNLPGGAAGQGVLVNTTAGGTESIAGVPLGGYNWEYDATAGEHGSVRRSIGGAPAAGHVYTFTYQAQFPITVRVPAVAPADVVEAVINRPDVYDYDMAFALGQAELDIATNEPDTIKYKTLEAGYIKTGQTQTITVAERDTNVTATVTEVTLRNTKGNQIVRDVTAVSGEVAQRPVYRSIVKSWLDRGTGVSAGAGTAAAPSSGVPGAPVKSVQFNRSGAFGGDDAFIYHEDQNSVVCGDLSDITAGNFESCQVFGYDNHITDS